MQIENLKKLVFHQSFEDQQLHGQQKARQMSGQERLAEMHRLNCKVAGEGYGRRALASRIIEIYRSQPGESVNDFYQRIDKEQHV